MSATAWRARTCPRPRRSARRCSSRPAPPGRRFAARNAEAVFLIAPSREIARAQIEDTCAQAVAFGRREQDITFYQGLSFVVGSTEAEARAKAAEHDEHVRMEGYAAHAALVDPDGRVYPPQTPLRELRTNSMRGQAEWLQRHITDREPLVADLVRRRAQDGRNVGTPEQIADELERWQAAGVDGINVANWVIPGSFAEFADHVMPVLRERGLAQEDYALGPLRQKLFGQARLDERHPAAAYRGAFGARGTTPSVERVAEELVAG